jgi:CubicO group peptidase (beta-lactamase class C family)
MMKLKTFVLVLFILFLLPDFNISREVIPQSVPQKRWMAYKSPEQAGYSSEKLNMAKQYFNEIGAAATVVIYKGKVLVAWGEIERRFKCHSIRKSFMSALYGVFVDKGQIDLNKTLADLAINDRLSLTSQEKQARIIDLLRARSGVYHPAAYETTSMKRARPRRGSHQPGTFWYYNNWDFNTLSTIFEKETDKKVFEQFKKVFADPLQMEDFRLMDTYYHFEKHNSIHPAYPFRMSARDMARFGLLFLREGRWGEQQIVSQQWVKKSTSVTSNTSWRRGGYGYMWWINLNSPYVKSKMISALGAGGHRIDVLPDEDIVFVFRVNTYKRNMVPAFKSLTLLKKILTAKITAEIAQPDLIPLQPLKNERDHFNINPSKLDRYTGWYEFPSGYNFKISKTENQLLIDAPWMGTFKILPLSETKFIVEDIEIPVNFILKNGVPETITVNYASGDIDIGRLKK